LTFLKIKKLSTLFFTGTLTEKINKERQSDPYGRQDRDRDPNSEDHPLIGHLGPPSIER